MSKQPFSLKGEMTLINVMVLHSTSCEAIRTALEAKREEVSQLLAKSPIIIDCTIINESFHELDMKLLREAVKNVGFVPVGVRNYPEEYEEAIQEAGWSVLRPGATHAVAKPVETAPSEAQDTSPAPEPEKEPTENKSIPRSLTLLEKPVRSGQQVYAKTGDIVVLQMTSAGSELLAAGSVHVYGSLRGRVLAGIFGDTSVRIFCQKLEAELVAIAGRYRLLDDIDTELKGKPAMIYLDGEKLMIEPMF